MNFFLTTLFVILAAATAVCLVFVFLMAPERRARGGKIAPPTRFYAHRGLHDQSCPENSLNAFARAVAAGYGIELDVQLSSDGEVVVFHDDTLERACGVAWRVRETPYSELARLTLFGSGERIPRFAEVLALVGGRMPLIVELKCHKRAEVEPLCRAVAGLLDRYSGEYWVESFNPLAVKWFKKHRPHVIRGQLADAFLRKRETRSPLYFMLHNLLFGHMARPDFVAYNHQNADALALRLVARIYRPVLVAWTVRDRAELVQAIRRFDCYIFEGFAPRL